MLHLKREMVVTALIVAVVAVMAASAVTAQLVYAPGPHIIIPNQSKNHHDPPIFQHHPPGHQGIHR
jgi:hypothetical protein